MRLSLKTLMYRAVPGSFISVTSCIFVTTPCSLFFFFKKKTAYEMRISDWSSDVCSADLLQTHRDSYAKRQSPRKRAFRVCPAPLQAHLREGRRAGRNPQARVLREADPGAQAQGRRRREAPGAPHLARRHQAPAPVLRQARVLPLARPARRSRISTKPARASVAGFLSLQCHPACPFVLQERLQPGSPPHIRPPEIPMTLKQRLTADMKAAMQYGDQANPGLHRPAKAAQIGQAACRDGGGRSG